MVLKVVLKSILWNPNYLAPQGYVGPGKSFPAQKGWGGEKWNAKPIKIENRAYFFVQEYEPIEKRADTGPTAVIMIAYNRNTKSQYLVGIACDVEVSSRNRQKRLAKNYPLARRFGQLRKMKEVQKKYQVNSDQWESDLYSELSDGAHHHFALSAPTKLYHWFKKPILVRAQDYTGKKWFKRYYSGLQEISAAMAIRMIGKQLSGEHAIIKWLRKSAGALENSSSTPSAKGNGKPIGRKLQGGNATDKAYIRFVKENEIAIPAKHHELQRDFSNYTVNLKPKYCGGDAEPPIDAIFVVAGETILVEYKTCQADAGYYALRAATAQLIDYWIRVKNEKPKHLFAVLDSCPGADGIAFIKALNQKNIPLSAFWRDAPKSKKFKRYPLMLNRES